ncbi:MAG: Hydrogenase 2 maturation protease [Verrucomicrobia bacterium ADurb.Bin006]|nr:MAG: Hydrogenase 2 maturation protease [Verrucomicrobia bacterium ADurb.Bin006]HRZ55253.1 hydrogenase maturation protease [Candidatus Paceibacterota bacterium]
MPDLRAQLEPCLSGRVCFVGLGNADQGDDGAGMRLAEALRTGLHPGAARRGEDEVFDAGTHSVVLAGTALERWGAALGRLDVDRFVFLDAVDFGGHPGSAVWLEGDEIRARFPQVSTHRMSLGAWARWLEADGSKRVWLLGVQPESLRAGRGLSAPVAAAVSALAQILLDAASPRQSGLSDSKAATAPLIPELSNMPW